LSILLKRLKDFSATKASVYVLYDDIKKTHPFANFLNRYYNTPYEGKLINLVGRLKSMGTKTGVLDEFLKLNESETKNIAENMCAIFDSPDKEMRIFCIKISEKIIIVGDGGPKPKNIRKWQDCSHLSRCARDMMIISELIKTYINNGTLSFSNNGLLFEGNTQIKS